jgi:hypothetical protein
MAVWLLVILGEIVLLEEKLKNRMCMDVSSNFCQSRFTEMC